MKYKQVLVGNNAIFSNFLPWYCVQDFHQIYPYHFYYNYEKQKLLFNKIPIYFLHNWGFFSFILKQSLFSMNHAFSGILSLEFVSKWTSSSDIYLFKVTNGNTRTVCEVCLKLTIKTSEGRQWCCSCVFIVNFE